MKWILYCDGASRGNPGKSGAGVFLVNADNEEFSYTRYLGIKTNNQAEYEALILGLEELQKKEAGEVEIRADSELLVKQIKGEYRVKHEKLIPLYKKVIIMLKNFSSVKIKHIPREENKRADRLSNEAIDFRGE